MLEKEGCLCKNSKLFNKIKTLASRNSPFRRKFDYYWKKYYCLGEGYNYLLPHLLGAVAELKMKNLKNPFGKNTDWKNYEKIFVFYNNTKVLKLQKRLLT